MPAGCEEAGSPGKIEDRAWKGCSSCLLGVKWQAVQVRLQIVHGRDAVHVCWCEDQAVQARLQIVPGRDAVHVCWVRGDRQPK